MEVRHKVHYLYMFPDVRNLMTSYAENNFRNHITKLYSYYLYAHNKGNIFSLHWMLK
jgi:hypothetical protein